MTGVSALILPEDAIEIVQGSSRTLRVTITDPDENPIDITGGKVYFSVKQDVADSHTLIQKVTTNPTEGAVTKPKAGQVELYLKPADTHNMQTTVDYVFDIWLVTLSGDRFDVTPPTMFKVKSSVTRIPV